MSYTIFRVKNNNGAFFDNIKIKKDSDFGSINNWVLANGYWDDERGLDDNRNWSDYQYLTQLYNGCNFNYWDIVQIGLSVPNIISNNIMDGSGGNSYRGASRPNLGFFNINAFCAENCNEYLITAGAKYLLRYNISIQNEQSGDYVEISHAFGDYGERITNELSGEYVFGYDNPNSIMGIYFNCVIVMESFEIHRINPNDYYREISNNDIKIDSNITTIDSGNHFE